jgi:NAD-dependent dihydropyrimidine dehydrogenase PreA subunit
MSYSFDRQIERRMDIMIAYHGFKDGSGEWFLIIDTDRCNGCGKCTEVCPGRALEVGSDSDDPFREEPVARVKDEERENLRYTCAPCKPAYGETPAPCIVSCEGGALSHTEAWKLMYARY